MLGGFAFRGGGSGLAKSASGKGTETPMQLFERYLKESGLGSKVWRVREQVSACLVNFPFACLLNGLGDPQSILTLVHIRRTHHMFPLRPYLTLLVETLEDSDSTVREVARSSVVELFTGPGVTDAARSDLKKELTKKGVRKVIVDDVLAKVLGGRGSNLAGSEMGSENGDAAPPAKKEYIPPSLALKARGDTAPFMPSTSEKSAGAMTRSASGGVPLSSRPQSRAAGVVSPPLTPVGEGNTDIRPVYVSKYLG